MNNLDGKYLHIRPQFWGGTYNKVLGSSANDMLYYPRYKSVKTDANGKSRVLWVRKNNENEFKWQLEDIQGNVVHVVTAPLTL